MFETFERFSREQPAQGYSTKTSARDFRVRSGTVNPTAGYERDMREEPVPDGAKQNIAVVGAGPAGLSFATTAARRGHHVTLFEAGSQVGGQFNMAKRIPGKEEFNETLRYFGRRLELAGANRKTRGDVSPSTLEPPLRRHPTGASLRSRWRHNRGRRRLASLWNS